MAGFRLFVVDNGGNTVVPVSAATFYTPAVTPQDANQYDNWQFYIEFFSDAAGTVPVTPTAGTITVNASPLGNNYLAASNTQVIQANTCSTPDSTYTPPAAEGMLTRGRITLAGITGAQYFRAVFWRY